MKVIINGTEYEYYSKIVEIESIRNNFIAFINENFGFNFSTWYQEGFWTDKYEPHVLVKDNQVVSTVTVNHMKYLFGEKRSYIQIGGVLTREGYLRKGLSRWLMEHIVEQYKDKCEQMFLFSDDVAVDFYPKMGFKKIFEYIGSYKWRKDQINEVNDKQFTIRRLDISDKADRKILLDSYKLSNPLSVFPSVDCEELVVFYGLEFKKSCYYYFENLGLVVIAELYDLMILNDIYGKIDTDIKLDKMSLISILVTKILEYNNIQCQEFKVLFGFSPIEELSDVKIEPLIQEDDTTFLLADKENIFEHNKIRFPLLSHN